MINIIAAVSKNGVIGGDNKLLWKLNGDMKRFKKLTTNNTVIMGRKTFESIGKELPNRKNIIISRSNTNMVSSIDEALELANNDCFIIGGGEIYRQTIHLAERLYITIVDVEIEGDTYFPEISEEWIPVSKKRYLADEKNEYNYTFIEYIKLCL